MDALPANRSWQPPCSHGTYQHKAITSRSRQLRMMGTWLPETCWATIRREIKNTKSDIQLVFFIHTEGVGNSPSPSDYHIFGFVKNQMRGQHYEKNEALQTAVRQRLRATGTEFYRQVNFQNGAKNFYRETGIM